MTMDEFEGMPSSVTSELFQCFGFAHENEPRFALFSSISTAFAAGGTDLEKMTIHDDSEGEQ